MTGSLLVRRAGLLTTVQDLGRFGFGRFGVSVSGALDPLALRVANRLVGNPEGASALEITAVGPELEFSSPTRFALAGANLSPVLDGTPIEVWRSYRAEGGSVLGFGARRQGARSILAVAGGLALPRVFGSAATDLEGGLGGVDGKPLRAGQTFALGETGESPLGSAGPAILHAYADPFELRFVPDDDSPLGPGAIEVFTASRYRVSERSNRMGYRLLGPPVAAEIPADMVSEPIPPGAIQVPSGGQPILLMADRQTVGGYPRLGTLIAADVPKAAQLWIGHSVLFRRVTIERARQALTELESWLERAVPA